MHIVRTHLLLITIVFAFCIGAHDAYAQTSFTGRWEGAIKLPGMDLGIIVNITRTNDSLQGTIDIPMQMAKGLPLRDLAWTGADVRFALQAGPGLASFAGTLAGDSVAGTFTQAAIRCPFIVRRAVPPAAAPPLPYAVEEVTIPSSGISLSGTLTLPKGDLPHRAVILLTGSGPQTRDEDIFGFAVFRTLADHLTRNGFAVLRCDDRGVGSSTGDFAKAVTDDFAADALAQFQFLRERKDIDHDAIGFLGHSEGGLVATMVSSKEQDVAFVILLAGPAVRGDKVISGQIERMMRSAGQTDSSVQHTLLLQERVYASARADSGWVGVRSMLLDEMRKSMAGMTPEQRATSGITDSVLSSRVEVKMGQVRSPWFRRFITYDPAPDMKRITCPMLALYGSLDSQVPAVQNRPVLEGLVASSGKENIAIRTLEGANHLFQAAVTGSSTEYGSLKKEFKPGVLDGITEWLLHTIPRRHQ